MVYCKIEIVLSAACSEFGDNFSSSLPCGLFVVLTGDAGRAGKAPVASGTGRLGRGTGGFGNGAAITYGATAGSGRLFLMGSAILEVVAIWETKGWVSLKRQGGGVGCGKIWREREKSGD